MKRKRPQILAPTKRLYRHHDLSFYYEGKTAKKPEPVDISFAELLLNTEDGSLIQVRCDQTRDRAARIMLDIIPFPTCDAAMNYARIWGREAAYLCDEDRDGGTETWYKIDHSAGKKEIRKLYRPYQERLTFEEGDKITPERKFEFDGCFKDLLEALQREGFTLVE